MTLEENKIYKGKEIAAWFGIKPETFSTFKAKKLNELKNYYEFEDLGKKGVRILKVLDPSDYVKPCITNATRKNFNSALEQERSLTKIKRVAETLYKDYKQDYPKDIQFNSICSSTYKVKLEYYGVPSTHSKEGRKGSLGSVRWCFAILKPEEGHYRRLTAEEEEVRRRIYGQEIKPSECLKEILEDYQIWYSNKGGVEMNDKELMEAINEKTKSMYFEMMDKYFNRLNDELGGFCSWVQEFELDTPAAEWSEQ